MISADVKTSYDTIRERVAAVAALHKRCAFMEGAGRLCWRIGVPLLLILLVQLAIGLTFWLRLFVIPLLGVGIVYWGWRWIMRPLMERYSPTRAALLVESKRPEFRSKIVSALETYADLHSAKPRFDSDMIQALILHAQESTRTEDFRTVVDRRATHRQIMLALLTVTLWIGAIAYNPIGIRDAFWSMATAWADLRNVAQKVAGAKIIVDPLDKPAYLVSSDVHIRARQQGFRNDSMSLLIREKDATEWRTVPVTVNADGATEYVAREVKKPFQFHFAAGQIESDDVNVVVTETPRITNVTVEYEMPEYVRRGTIVQPRSDGNLKSLFGSIIVLTVETNKPLKAASMAGTFLKQPEAMKVAGTFAKAIIRLDDARWQESSDLEIKESYTLHLTDEFGFGNADASHAYELTIVKDQAPKVSFIGLPHRSSADELHVLEQNLGGIPVAIKASDDYGISKVTLKYRIEELENGAEKKKDRKEIQFALPRADIPQLAMLRLSDIGAVVGDRIIISAEVEDAYNLEPAKGPHKASTPAYRIAVVTQEELFNEAVYKDDWSTQWYESLQVASLSKREIPPRSSPESEPAAKVAAKLLEASQVGDGVKGSDQQLMQDYFDSLHVIKAAPASPKGK